MKIQDFRNIFLQIEYLNMSPNVIEYLEKTIFHVFKLCLNNMFIIGNCRVIIQYYTF